MNPVIRQIASQLQAVYPANEAQEMAWWVVEETTGLSRTQLLCGCKDTNFSANMQEIIDRLLHFEPIQYIFGHTFWCGLDLKVTPDTLIPRPETAGLIDAVNALKLPENGISVLDIGTGSGCIAIALKKKHPQWVVEGIDISFPALAIAQENAERNKVKINFKKVDILSDFNEDSCKPFDIIVSNPPYICEREKENMRANVLDYEPASALFVPDSDPLLFYKRIVSLRLSKYVFFEINEAYAMEIERLMNQNGYTEILTSKDIYGKERIIQGRIA